MINTKHFLYLTFIFLFFSCKKEEVAKPIIKRSEANLLTFSIKKDNNSALITTDIDGCIKKIVGLSENILTLNYANTKIAKL